MQVIDLRASDADERFALLAEAFDALQLGDTFDLIAEHDPQPLLDRLREELGAPIAWHALAKGPDAWRLQVGRAAAAALGGLAFHRGLVALVGDAPPDAIVSRQVVSNEAVKVTVFGFAAGQELSEHTASKPALLQVLAGEGTFGLGDEVVEVGPGAFVYLPPHLPHAVTARTPLVLLLTMIKAGGG